MRAKFAVRAEDEFRQAPGRAVMAKAAAEVMKLDKRSDKGGGDEGGGSGWMSEGLGWFPRKLQELKSFFGEVKSELKKVTWPSRKEVYATTVVVIVTTLFFGFYLWLLDVGFSWLYEHTVGKL
jgi:preprotein translocase SecE subunit